jgi:hypothetical protein
MCVCMARFPLSLVLVSALFAFACLCKLQCTCKHLWIYKLLCVCKLVSICDLACICQLAELDVAADPLSSFHLPLQPAVQVVPTRPPSSRRQEKDAATLAAAAAQAQADAAAAAAAAAADDGYTEGEQYEQHRTASGVSHGRGDGLAETTSGQRKRSRRLFPDADDQQQEQFLGSQGTSKVGKGVRSGKRQKHRGGRGGSGKYSQVWDGEWGGQLWLGWGRSLGCAL